MNEAEEHSMCIT